MTISNKKIDKFKKLISKRIKYLVNENEKLLNTGDKYKHTMNCNELKGIRYALSVLEILNIIKEPYNYKPMFKR